MTNAIELLERIGRDATLRHAPPAELVALFADEAVPEDVQSALIRGDRLELERVLGAQSNICCAIQPSHEEEDEEDEEDDVEEEDDEEISP